MKKKTNGVFMSCIINDVYKEFQIDGKSINTLKTYLKNNFKKARFIEKEENIVYLKCMKLFHVITSSHYLDLEEFYDSKDTQFNMILKEVLTNLTLTPSFEIEKKDIQEWLYCMGRRARSGRLEEYRIQDYLVSGGIRNTDYLDKLEISLIGNHFITQPPADLREHANREEIKSFVKQDKKRA